MAAIVLWVLGLLLYLVHLLLIFVVAPVERLEVGAALDLDYRVLENGRVVENLTAA